MRNSHSLRSRQVIMPLFRGIVLGAVLAGFGATANATDYNEGTSGDLSNLSGAPTNIGALTVGDNDIVGSSIPSGSLIPNGHGALTVQDSDFFTFTVPTGDVLYQFRLGKDSSIVQGDRFFLGIYPGDTSPVDPSNPTPAGLLGYTLPGTPQIGTDLLPALAASNEPGFPSLPSNFSGDLGPGEYTVWVVDGDSPLQYNINLAVAPAPEPATWALMMAGLGLTGAMVRRRRPGSIQALA